MAFEPELEENENVEEDITLTISSKVNLRLILTDKAAYWPGKKAFAVSDPIVALKTDLSEITQVYIGRKSALGSLLVAIAMVIGGIVWTLFGYVGLPQALIIGGFIFGIVGGRRRIIRIGSLSWTAPITFGGETKKEVESICESIRVWAQKHSLPIRP